MGQEESLSYWENVLKEEEIKYEVKDGTLHANVDIRDGDGHSWRDLYIEKGTSGKIIASVIGPHGIDWAKGLGVRGAINLFIRDKDLFFTERD